MNNIFVGNLSFSATKEDVQKLFEPFGMVANVVIMERKKGKSRGYAFVDMPNEEEKNKAIEGLEGKEFMYRVLSVSPVIPKVPGQPKKKFKPVGASKPWFKKDKEPNHQEGPSADRGPRSEKPWIKQEGGRGRSTENVRYEGKPYRKEAKPYKRYSKTLESKNKPYRQDDREIQYGGKNKAPAKPAYNKFGAYPRAGSKRAGAPVRKPGGPFKKFFKMGHRDSGNSK